MNKKDLLKVVKENGRTINFLTEWSINEDAPVLGLTSLDRRSQQMVADKKVDLRDYAKKIKRIKEGEVFTIGRNPDCDVRPGYKEWVKTLIKTESSVQTAENTYMNIFTTVSRIHAFVERDGNTFRVYDCSYAGTIIVPSEPKKPWWKRIIS